MKRYQEELFNELPGVKISKVETPEGEDINSLFLNYDKDAILQLIDERKLFLLSEETEVEPPEIPQEIKGRMNTSNPEFITYTTPDLQIILLGGINL